MSDRAQLHGAIYALRFNDILALAKTLKPDGLGFDANRKFQAMKNAHGGDMKTHFADWVLDHCDHAAIAAAMSARVETPIVAQVADVMTRGVPAVQIVTQPEAVTKPVRTPEGWAMGSDYCAARGRNCPQCGARAVSCAGVAARLDVKLGKVTVPAWCNACEAKWDMVFNLTGYERVSDGERPAVGVDGNDGES